jgi:hypothetical protein
MVVSHGVIAGVVTINLFRVFQLNFDVFIDIISYGSVGHSKPVCDLRTGCAFELCV